ncbi:MAG TPA: sigma-54 dependent transcriptional regulator, partial [Thermoanaerobaculia bacterium]
MSRLLIVEDDEKIRASLLLQLREEGYAPQALSSAEEASAYLEDPRASLPDLLLLDVRLRAMSGVDLVRRLVEAKRLPPTIIISGEASISETVEALRLGIHDFIEKPFSRERLLQSIHNALEHQALKREVATLRADLRGEPEILGSSPAIEELRRKIERAAATDARMLIVGESGTGKELVASALHRQSERSQKAFIKINCAAIPHHLVEDELFGHVKGAFTDAKTAKPGLFEEADGGTLFLDEIGDMDLTVQSRLLRVLEDGLVRRVGETRDRQVDVRVLAATNRRLEEEVKAGRFREDLYFRLAHLPLQVPSLRERREDIRLLFDHFLDRFSRQHRTRPRRATPDLYACLEGYAWPGNVRELRNLAE